MMKYFAYILSVYVVILTMMPCIDIHQGNTFQKIEVSTNTSDSHQNDSDQCSPFCTCTCCSSSVAFLDIVIQYGCFPIIREHISKYTSSYNSTQYVSIWQPPKIA